MGDRAIVIFYDRDRVSPVVYLHCNGEHVPAWLNELREVMRGREDDAGYGCARFIGLCHTKIEGPLSLGTWNLPARLAKSVASPDREPERARALARYSHGDAGVVLVNAADYTWRAYGGYLATPTKTGVVTATLSAKPGG